MAKSTPSSAFYWNDYYRDTRALSPAAKGIWMDILCRLHESPTRGVLTLSVEHWALWCGCSSDELLAAIIELHESHVTQIHELDQILDVMMEKEPCNVTDNVTDNVTGNAKRNAEHNAQITHVTHLSRSNNVTKITQITIRNARMIREEKAKMQNMDKLEKLKEQNRLRQARFRQKIIHRPERNGSSRTVTVGQALRPSSSSSSSSSVENPSVGSLPAKREPPSGGSGSDARQARVGCGFHERSGLVCQLPAVRNIRSRPRCAWHQHVEESGVPIQSYADFVLWHQSQPVLKHVPVEELWEQANAGSTGGELDRL